MGIASYKDAVKWVAYPRRWIKTRWFRATAVLSVLSYLLWRAVVWAMLPGYWEGNLFGGGRTLLDTAKHHFGPVLLVHRWIGDPPGYWGKLTLQQEGEMLRMWGQHESLARFKLIIALLWTTICVLVLLWKNRTIQPRAAPNGGPATPSGNSGVTEGPPSVS